MLHFCFISNYFNDGHFIPECWSYVFILKTFINVIKRIFHLERGWRIHIKRFFLWLVLVFELRGNSSNIKSNPTKEKTAHDPKEKSTFMSLSTHLASCIIFQNCECVTFNSWAAGKRVLIMMGWGGGSTFGRVGREAKGQASSVVVINTAVTSGKWSICLMCHFQSGTLVILQTWQPHHVYRPSGIWSELKLFTNVWRLTFIESGL